MGARESNQGFIDLHTPLGVTLLTFAIFLFIAFIVFGAVLFKVGLQRDKAVREELKKHQSPPPNP